MEDIFGLREEQVAEGGARGPVDAVVPKHGQVGGVLQEEETAQMLSFRNGRKSETSN